MCFKKIHISLLGKTIKKEMACKVRVMLILSNSWLRLLSVPKPWFCCHDSLVVAAKLCGSWYCLY